MSGLVDLLSVALACFAAVAVVVYVGVRLLRRANRAVGASAARLAAWRATAAPIASLEPEGATWRSYLAEAPAWLIVFGALAVSFWTQVFAVNGRHFAFWEALIWGASTDAGTIAFLFLAREGIYKGTATWGAWLGSIVCAAMSVQWNVIPAWEAGDYLGVESHLWMPALALGTWYWLLHGRKRRWARRPPIETPAPEPEPEPPALLPPPPGGGAPPEALPEANPEPKALTQPDGRKRVTLAKATEVYRGLAKKGRVTGSALGDALGVSHVMGRNWKRKVEAAAKPRPFRIAGRREAPGTGRGDVAA